MDLKVVTNVGYKKLSEYYVKSEENVKYPVSNHSVQQKIRKNSTSSKIYIKSVSSNTLSRASHIDLDEHIGSIVFKVKQNLNTFESQCDCNLTVPVTSMPFSWLGCYNYNQILDNQSEQEIEDYDILKMIEQAEKSEDTKTIHVRYTYGQFGDVEREVTVKRIKMGGLEYALKQDTNRFQSTSNNVRAQICKRFSNWFKLSKDRPRNILQIIAAQVQLANQSTLITKSLTPFHEGRTLNEFMSTTTLDDQQIISIANQIVDALNFLHTKGFVHGDVKPHNFLCHTINDTFLLTLIDMDSLSLDREITVIDSTVLYKAIGIFITPSYEADIWALGLTLYSLVSSQKIIMNWGYSEYRQRDQQLPQYVDGYGVLNEILMLCLSRQPYKDRNLINISALIKQQINL